MWSTVDRADTPRPRRTQFEDTYTTVCMDLLDGALSLVNSEAPVISIPVHSSLVPWPTHTPCLDSNSGIMSHGHTHRLGAWRLRNPVAGGVGSCYLFTVSGYISHGGLHSGHIDGTAMQRHARG